jgi:short-subunit dehydrogenase
VSPPPLVALITGASSGIGEATARRLASELGDRPAHFVLIARREERLLRLADTLPVACTCLALDLTDEDAPERARAHLQEHCEGRLSLLVNNAGASWRGTFADGGYANVQRTMALNFDSVLRLTEALLPLLRACAPSAIVNVASTAARVTRPGTGSYSASKAALAAWSDALYAEEREHDVHVGLVLPGFIATEGFPASELTQRPLTAWMVSTPDRAAEAIIDAGLHRRPERYVPRAYALFSYTRLLAPGLVRRIITGRRGAILTTRTGAEQAAPLAVPADGHGAPGAERETY